jgi:pimeloyl-ACP methyl ester carboxylesterase
MTMFLLPDHGDRRHATEGIPMTSHTITGGGGTRLHVVETGNARGRPILFIHGFSQCSLAWSRQLDSDLAQDFRLVAMDLRGHGLSDKPAGGYDDSRLWADDIHAVIESLRLERPLLCCWSYGLTLMDYLRHYGDADIAGMQLVGAITRLGSEEAFSVLTPEMLQAAPGLFTTDAVESVRNLQAFIRLCSLEPPALDELYLMLGYNATVPPFVRQALFSRVVDNDDVLAKIRKPLLVTHGANDAIVKPAAADLIKARVAHADVDIMPGIGHAPFRENAPAFNQRLRMFAETLRQPMAA